MLKNKKLQNIIAIIMLCIAHACLTVSKNDAESSVWWLIIGTVIAVAAIVLLIIWSKDSD